MNQLLIVGLVLGWGGILSGLWLGWQLLRQNGRLLLRIEELEKRLDELEFGEREAPEGLPTGSEAPDFELPDLAGERKALAHYRGRPIVLIFFNPDCGFCREMLAKLAALGEHAEVRSQKSEGEGHPNFLILTSGNGEKNRQLFAEHEVRCPVLLQMDGEISKAFQAHGTPSGYLIDSDGKIASPLAMGAEALLALAEGKAENAEQKAGMEADAAGTAEAGSGNGEARSNRFGKRSLANSKIKRDGLKAGTAAPDFLLPRLDGKGGLSLSALRGKPVLLVFSSPGCGPCNQLAPELERFHRQNPKMELVMISKGEPGENRAKVREHGLTFPIVLQQQWEISRRYAIFATPVAYLIDESGVIARDVAVGADAIEELLLEPKRFATRLELVASG